MSLQTLCICPQSERLKNVLSAVSEEEAELVAPVKPEKKAIMLDHIQDGCLRVVTMLSPRVPADSWLCSHVGCVSMMSSRVVTSSLCTVSISSVCHLVETASHPG